MLGKNLWISYALTADFSFSLKSEKYTLISFISRHFQLHSLHELIRREKNIPKLFDMSELCMKKTHI